MDAIAVFIGYLTVHRMLVFACGIVSIVLGYRLLMRGMAGSAAPGQGQSLEAALGKAKLTARNLAPGSLFALFGAGLVAAMVLHAPPEVSIDVLEKGGARFQAELRGNDSDAAQARGVTDAMRALQAGNTTGARDMAARLGQSGAAQWNDLAWVLARSGGNAAMAGALAQAALAAEPANAEYMHTLATAQKAGGDPGTALITLRKAAALDSKFQPQVKEWTLSSDAK